VPASFPPGVTNRCAWLLEHGYGPMKITGRDSLHLDTNHNGTACDEGDR
jgi:hypothetical protein